MDMATKEALGAISRLMIENGMVWKLAFISFFVFIVLCYKLGND